MGMNSKMSAQAAVNKRADAVAKMYKDDKNFRADKLIEAWSRIPEVNN